MRRASRVRHDRLDRVRVVAFSLVTRPLNIFIAHPSHLLTDHRGHGDGLVAFGFIRELARRGHQLHVAVDRADIAELLPSNIRLYEIPRRVPGAVLRRLEYMLGVRGLLRRLRRTTEIDVVHQLNPVYTGLSLAFAGMREPIVLGTYIAGWPVPPMKGPRGALLLLVQNVTRWIARAQQDRARALLVTTQHALRERIVTPARQRDKVFFQQHGVDIAKFRPAEDRGAMHAAQRILFVAALRPKKGIYTLIDAMRTIARECPSARLVVAGGGELERVSEYARDAGVGEVVDFLGNQERDQIASLMRSSAVLCMPSFGEPYGMSVLEAFASGLPVVVTDAGGLPELVDAVGGEKVAPGDSAALAAALVGILRSPDRAEAMSQHNRMRAESEFSWSRVADALEDTYRKVIGSRS